MTVQDLHTEAAPRPAPAARLPWHLRKRFVLPVVTVLLLGAVSSITLLAGAVYTYVRVQLALQELQSDLSQLGLLPASADAASADTAAATPDDEVNTGTGDVGEAGRVTYLLEGDLDGVEAKWTVDAVGTVDTAKLSGHRKSLTYVVDGSWETVGISAERTSGTGSITCSVIGEDDVVLSTMTDQGRGASVICS